MAGLATKLHSPKSILVTGKMFDHLDALVTPRASGKARGGGGGEEKAVG